MDAAFSTICLEWFCFQKVATGQKLLHNGSQNSSDILA